MNAFRQLIFGLLLSSGALGHMRLADNILQHTVSARAAPFRAPTYLPPVENLICHGGDVCVQASECVKGYFSIDLGFSKRTCDINTEVCCTYKPKPTPLPSIPCGSGGFDCVSPNECINGEISIKGYKQKVVDQCFAPEVCCRVPVESTILEKDGYHVRVPETPFVIAAQYPKPKSSHVAIIPSSQSSEYLRPETSLRAHPTSPPETSLRAHPTSPPETSLRAHPTSPPETSLRAHPTSPPRVLSRNKSSTTNVSPREPIPTAYVPLPPRSFSKFLPPVTSTPLNYPTYYSTPVPNPSKRPVSTTYVTQTPPAIPVLEAKPPVTPASIHLTSQEYGTKVSSVPNLNNEYIPPRAQESTNIAPKVYIPPKLTTLDTYVSPKASTPMVEYIPPRTAAPTNYVPQIYIQPNAQAPNGHVLPKSSTNYIPSRTPAPTNYVPQIQLPVHPKLPVHAIQQNPRPVVQIPPSIPNTPTQFPSNRPPLRGEDVKSEPIYKPKPQTYVPQIKENVLSQPISPKISQSCAAALKCTPINFCTKDGVISKTPVSLTPNEELYRVPLTDCSVEASAFQEGKCCRDPDYVDPWPTNLLVSGKYDPTLFQRN